MADGTLKEYAVEDHAWRLLPATWTATMRTLPPYFVTALEISADAHAADGRRGRAVHRHQHLEDGERARGLSVRGFPGPLLPGLEVGPEGPRHLPAEQGARLGAQRWQPTPQDFAAATTSTAASRSKSVPAPVLAVAALARPPRPAGGNPAWTYMVEHPHGRFALFVGHVENGRPRRTPFEVWVNGSEQPRGLGALAKTLSMDMRADDRAWLQLKLDALAKTGGDERVRHAVPAARRAEAHVLGVVAAFAQIVRWRVEQLRGGWPTTFRSRRGGLSPVLDAHVRAEGAEDRHRRHACRWTVDVLNPRTGDDFVLA